MAYQRIWITFMLNSEMDKYVCRVCGLVNDEPPWGDDAMTASFDMCPCCGVDFGYEDATAEAAGKFRKKWIAGGAKWISPDQRPVNWSLEKQLENVPRKFQIE
jgi:hypothetical protein